MARSDRFYEDTSMGEFFGHNPVLAVQRRQLATYLDDPGPDPATGVVVLDIGCGAGTTTKELFGDDPRFVVVGATSHRPPCDSSPSAPGTAPCASTPSASPSPTAPSTSS